MTGTRDMRKSILWFISLFLFLAVVPCQAQEEEEFFEEEFDEEFLDEDFLDEEGFMDEEDAFLEGEEFGEDEFFEEEGDIGDEDFGGFDEEMGELFEEDFEGDTRVGYTIMVSGGMPTFRNSTLLPWLGSPNGRIGVDLPFYLSLGPIGFRVGAEVGFYGFAYDETGLDVQDKKVLPLEGQFGGVGFFGIVTIPSGPANLRFGAGMLGTSPAYMAVQSLGFAVGDIMDLRLGVRATAAYNVPDGLTTAGTHMSWVDAFIAFGVTF